MLSESSCDNSALPSRNKLYFKYLKEKTVILSCNIAVFVYLG